eukprot:TRINITY_DN2125_c3_g1_i2.p1 TRINITY_DN2125_c3_g1~~TRINITY_DN2125_c3_g1_i2.p1  ORF type:complete len:363 (+),score=74.86 TRINITY_DN2125_c3_g1_i2:75-1091(+)
MAAQGPPQRGGAGRRRWGPAALGAAAVAGAAAAAAALLPPAPEERVVIIGGGMAGIVAARDLREKGIPVVLVEGRHRVGGRVWTERRWGFPVDVCATFIHGVEANPVAREARRYGIDFQEVDYSKIVVYGADGKAVPSDDVRRMKQVYRQLRKRVMTARDRMHGDTDLRSAFAKAVQQLNISTDDHDRDVLSWHFYWEIVQDQVAQLRELSVLEFDASVMYEGRDAVLPGGMQQLADAIAQDIPLRVNSTVTRVEYGPNGVTAEIAGGATVRGTRALIALPLRGRGGPDVQGQGDCTASGVRPPSRWRCGSPAPSGPATRSSSARSGRCETSGARGST